VGSDFLEEGFEAALVPPAGWALLGRDSPPHTWHAATAPPYVRTGSSAALILWQDERIQDESLVTATVDLSAVPGSGLFLSFWWYTDPFWFGGENTVFRVHGSLDGAAWELLWTVEDFPEAGWAWRNAVVDVSRFAGVPGDFRVRFRYKGRNAANVALDDVRLGYLVPPGPPENDDCPGALTGGYTIGPATGPFLVTGNNTFARADYPLDGPTSCTQSSHSGRDLVWVVDLPAAHAITATMTTAGGWDDTLFLMSDCADPAGTCVAGNRSIPDGSTITFLNSGPATARYFLVASGYAAGEGEFTVEGGITQETAVESNSWGEIKARYRE
jgi:hypothetical protein